MLLNFYAKCLAIGADTKNCVIVSRLACCLWCTVAVGDVLLDFSLTVKAATLIFILGCGSAISSAKEGKSAFIYNLVKF